MSVLDLLYEQRESFQDEYVVLNFPGFSNHKIGLNLKGQISIFVKSHDNGNLQSKKIGYEFNNLVVAFDKTCIIFDVQSNKEISSIYTILTYNSENDSDYNYFIDLCSAILSSLGNLPKNEDVYKAIRYLIDLFTEKRLPSPELVRGLWSELFVIANSSNSGYLLDSWHCDSSEKFDFNDGITKLEVKSTIGELRKHSFSLGQLNPNLSNLYVYSLMMLKSPKGSSIKDLMDMIYPNLNSKQYLKLFEVVHQTIGDSIEVTNKYRFDFEYSMTEQAVYSCSSIPKIPEHCIPNGVCGVRFTSDLSEIDSISDPQGLNLLEYII